VCPAPSRARKQAVSQFLIQWTPGILRSATIVQMKPAAGRGAKRKSSIIEKLNHTEAASVLRMLLDRDPELRPEAEAIAKGVLSEVSPFSVADDVESAVFQYDYDDLNGRAGRHSWGYVEPTEAAWELMEEAVEPFVSEMKRYLEMGLDAQAQDFCQGILLGLYRVRDGGKNDILNWASDFPAEAAGNALDDWGKAAGAEAEGAPAKRKPRQLPRDFVEEHMPEWDWILKPGHGTR
jgi:hypothetical protein